MVAMVEVYLISLLVWERVFRRRSLLDKLCDSRII